MIYVFSLNCIKGRLKIKYSKKKTGFPSIRNPVCFIFNLERHSYTSVDGAARQWCDIFEHEVWRCGWQSCVHLYFMPLVYNTDLIFQK